MSNQQTKRAKLTALIETALLTAIIIVMQFTPLGYLKTAGLEISFIPIPVAVGAIVVGPAAGAFLGAIFGITSFMQCFGMSAFGTAMLSVNPFFCFIVCMAPRILMGWLTGLAAKAFEKCRRTKPFTAFVAVLCPLLNTVLFMTALLGLFGRTDFIRELQGEMNILAFAAAFVGINAVAEAVICGILGVAIAGALTAALRRIKRK